MYTTHILLLAQLGTTWVFKVLRPSGPNNWKNVEWIPYVFCREYNIVKNVKLMELWGKNLVPLHFVIF